MISLLYGIGALALVWWASRLLASVAPAVAAKRIRQAGGGIALATAALLLIRGRIDMAILLGGAGAWLLGWTGSTWTGIPWPGGKGRAAPTPGSVSRVRSAMIEMELDHDTGQMNGTVLAGALSGRRLESLPEDFIHRLYDECRSADPDGVRLLEAYLDRRFPRWREHAEGDAHPRPGARPETGVMTEEEAYQVLGLQPGAAREEVRRAHRALMKKFHPDQGGTTYLAARINDAKDFLLNRHR